jgi:glyoxylase-like metal-dependent hydrolase (beta-lactamase superfamily II)
MFSEGQNEGNESVLLNATPEMKQKTMPNGVYPTATNMFLVRTPTENILIDAGFGRKIDAQLETIGITAEDIHKIFLTHMHGDHVGGLLLNDEPRFKNATLYIPLPEHSYWANTEIMYSFPIEKRSGFFMAKKVMEAYRHNILLFEPGVLNSVIKPLTTEIHAIAAYGHTPGHTLYMIESERQKLLIWGDLTHAMAIQMPYPQVAVTYDTDPETAVRSRVEILEYVTQHAITIAGMHVAYPAIGNIKRNEESGYRFIPINK